MRAPRLNEMVQLKWTTPFWARLDKSSMQLGLPTVLVNAGATCVVENIRLGGFNTVAEVLLRLGSGPTARWAWVSKGACEIQVPAPLQ